MTVTLKPFGDFRALALRALPVLILCAALLTGFEIRGLLERSVEMTPMRIAIVAASIITAVGGIGLGVLSVLALGARASADLVRTGTDGLRVDAVFEDVPPEPDAPLDDIVSGEGGVAIVRREVGADGRSSARVNDRAVTIGGCPQLISAVGPTASAPAFTGKTARSRGMSRGASLTGSTGKRMSS